jgi:t-SNARE complex subunit (syntaxin)
MAVFAKSWRRSRMKAWMRYEQAFVWVATIVVVLMVLGATAFFALDFSNQR